MSEVLFDTQGHVATITINKPEVMNALSLDTFLELSAAWAEFRDNDDLWVAVLTGAGERAFCAGADLKAMSGGRHPDSWSGAWHEPLQNHQLHRGLELWKPVIAAVNGHCHAGGLNLMLACDLRVAADHSSFSLAQVRRGIAPGNGGTQRLPRQLPYAIAMEMLLLGTAIDAPTALHHGLINRVVPMQELLPTAMEMAEQLCTTSAPLATRAIKQAVVRGLDMPLADGMMMEAFIAGALRQTEDAAEGPRAFKEKRPPEWKAR